VTTLKHDISVEYIHVTFPAGGVCRQFHYGSINVYEFPMCGLCNGLNRLRRGSLVFKLNKFN